MRWTSSLASLALLCAAIVGTGHAAPPEQSPTGGGLTLEEVYRLDKGGSVYDLTYIPGGQRALIGSDPTNEQLALFNVTEHKIERQIDQLGVFVAVSADGHTAAVTDFTPFVKLLSLDAPDEVRTLPHGDLAICVAFSPDGKRLASGGVDNSVCLWDVEAGKEVQRLRAHQGAVTNLAFAPNGKWLISASEDKTLRLWDPQSGKERLQIQQKERIWSTAVSPDSQSILSGAGGALLGNPLQLDIAAVESNPIRLWDAATGKLIRELKGHSHVVRSIDFSPDGKFACSGGFDKSLRVWDLRTGKQLARVDGEGWVNAAKYSPDGRYILCGGGIRRVDQQWIQSPEERVRLFRVHGAGIQAGPETK